MGALGWVAAYVSTTSPDKHLCVTLMSPNKGKTLTSVCSSFIFVWDDCGGDLWFPVNKMEQLHLSQTAQHCNSAAVWFGVMLPVISLTCITSSYSDHNQCQLQINVRSRQPTQTYCKWRVILMTSVHDMYVSGGKRWERLSVKPWQRHLMSNCMCSESVTQVTSNVLASINRGFFNEENLDISHYLK